jgi:hypothetical protein
MNQNPTNRSPALDALAGMASFLPVLIFLSAPRLGVVGQEWRIALLSAIALVLSVGGMLVRAGAPVPKPATILVAVYFGPPTIVASGIAVAKGGAYWWLSAIYVVATALVLGVLHWHVRRPRTAAPSSDMLAQPCAALSATLGEPLHGTAPNTTAWLLVERPASRWGTRRLGLGDDFERRIDELGIGLLLIRRDTPEPPSCFAVWTGRDRPWIERHSFADLRTLDLDALAAGRGPDPEHEWPHRLLVVCTDGRRDPCCGHGGGPLANALAAHAPDAICRSSHIGGHRLRPLLAFPDGLCFGRVAPEDAPQVADLHADGRIALEHFRGRVCDPPAVQAADAMLRDELDIDGIDALSPDGYAEEEDGTTHVFMRDAHGTVHEIRVRRVATGIPRPTGCGAPPRDPGRYERVDDPARDRE